nr:hypothetical protein [Tanacetum cinerariifolium]
RIALDGDDDVFDVVRCKGNKVLNKGLEVGSKRYILEVLVKYKVLEVMFWVKKGFSAYVSAAFEYGGSIRRIQLMDMAY